MRNLKSVFKDTKDPERLIRGLSLYSDVPIIAGRTLIVFDEIQECEEALNSLKYFYEEAPGYHIIAAGSLLGVAVKRKQMSVPAGKVMTLTMLPLTFKEFLAASDSRTYQFVENLQSLEHLPEIILNKLVLEYKRYSVCGGMPAAAVEFVTQLGAEIIPMEVKAENRISGWSLSEYTKKFNSNCRIRYSFQNLQYNGGLLSCPSPLACWTENLLRLAGQRI